MGENRDFSSKRSTVVVEDLEQEAHSRTQTLQIPDKIYFRIGEVARILEVETHVLRYWENQFPQLKPHKSNAKQRLYRRKDIELLNKIKNLLYKNKYTIQGAKNLLLENGGVIPDSISSVREVLSPVVKVKEGPEGSTDNIKKCINELNELLAIVDET